MNQEQIRETLAHLLSQLTPDVHTMEGMKGWQQVGSILSFHEIGQFGLRISASEEGAFLFEAIFGKLPITKDNLLLLNAYNLGSIFRGAVDEDGYLNIDYSYFGIRDTKELEDVFVHLLHTFSDPEHLEILKSVVKNAVFSA